MSEPLRAKIRVVSSDTSGQIADVTPQQFQQPDINQIAAITNEVVVHLQNNLQIAPPDKTKKADGLTLSEIELTFGIDLEAEVGGELKIPIIGPVVRGGIKGGATFEVRIKLSHEEV